MRRHDLAEVNIALAREPLDAPLLVDFIAALDPVNARADSARGFVWRMQTEDGDAMAVRGFGGHPQLIINLTVWESLEALRSFVYQQLRPLLFRDEISRYVRIFAWENVRPSKVLQKVMATNAAPFLTRATELVRRFLPTTATEQEAMCGAIWLMGQCGVFLRNREQFTQSPFNLKIDEPFVEWLADLITRLALGGLAQGWDLQPLESAAFPRRTPTTDSPAMRQ